MLKNYLTVQTIGCSICSLLWNIKIVIKSSLKNCKILITDNIYALLQLCTIKYLLQVKRS